MALLDYYLSRMKRRPFSNVPESSEWFDNSEDGGENNEVFFCFIYFITSMAISIF